MENLTNKEFQNSLDLTNDELESYIPQMLDGLWELGSMPEYMIELIERNNIGKEKNFLDLGCGKGAALVKIAKQFEINAIGVDIVPHFIEEANKYAHCFGVANKIIFKTEDILETLKKTSEQDIVIYGYDSEILGNLDNTLKQLSSVIKADGYILLEYMFANQQTEGEVTEGEMKNIIELAEYRVLDRIDWKSELLKQTNRQNTQIIKGNVDRLIAKYPGKKSIFNEYLHHQMDECEALENDYTCTTLLLRHKNYCVQ